MGEKMQQSHTLANETSNRKSEKLSPAEMVQLIKEASIVGTALLYFAAVGTHTKAGHALWYEHIPKFVAESTEHVKEAVKRLRTPDGKTLVRVTLKELPQTMPEGVKMPDKITFDFGNRTMEFVPPSFAGLPSPDAKKSAKGK